MRSVILTVVWPCILGQATDFVVLATPCLFVNGPSTTPSVQVLLTVKTTMDNLGTIIFIRTVWAVWETVAEQLYRNALSILASELCNVPFPRFQGTILGTPVRTLNLGSTALKWFVRVPERALHSKVGSKAANDQQ